MEKINDLLIAISLNNRQIKIETIKTYSAEEYEDLDSLWDLASKTDEQLNIVLKDIITYYLDENNN